MTLSRAHSRRCAMVRDEGGRTVCGSLEARLTAGRGVHGRVHIPDQMVTTAPSAATRTITAHTVGFAQTGRSSFRMSSM